MAYVPGHLAEREAQSAATIAEGVLTIPAALDQIVAAVLGLDQRPVARR